MTNIDEQAREAGRLLRNFNRSPAARDPKRLQTFALLVAGELRGILNQPGTGRLYKVRKGPSFKNVRNVVAGPLQKGEKRTRFTTQRRDLTKFHRASKRGEPPAPDTRTLQRSVFVERSGPLSYAVGVAINYAKHLDGKLRRPFMLPALQSALRKIGLLR